MNIVLTGSLGHIGHPLTRELIKKNHSVTVITSNANRKTVIETLGAKAAIGSIYNAGFLTNAFKGADIVYLMEPAVNFLDPTLDIEKLWISLANIYVEAIRGSGVKKVIHLSSVGAHTPTGNGMLAIHYNVESILKALPADVIIKFMRPVGFYYNMFAFIPTIKAQNTIIQNYGGDQKEPWVSPLDIAAAIAEEMENPFKERSVRYIASDEISPNEVAKILGAAIGKPELKWITIPDEQFLNGLISAGFNPVAANGVMQMNAGRRANLYDDYHQQKPVFGKIKMGDFAAEFAATYKNQHKTNRYEYKK